MTVISINFKKKKRIITLQQYNLRRKIDEHSNDKLNRIRTSLTKISRLMRELKGLSEDNQQSNSV